MKIADSPRIEGWLSSCNRWLDSWRGRVFLGTAVASVYLCAYWIHPEVPAASSISPLGWCGWWDQGQHLKCAAGLARASLTRDTYWYPLGYPALGALFYCSLLWLMPAPFSNGVMLRCFGISPGYSPSCQERSISSASENGAPRPFLPFDKKIS